MQNLPSPSFRIAGGNYARAAVEVYVASRGGYITRWASTSPYEFQPVRSYGDWCLC